MLLIICTYEYVRDEENFLEYCYLLCMRDMEIGSTFTAVFTDYVLITQQIIYFRFTNKYVYKWRLYRAMIFFFTLKGFCIFKFC